ncbi:MAG: hypothetical protein WC748_00595 [Legionellales bacterium]|jgi:predicted DNA binding CopG/RHH family protein
MSDKNLNEEEILKDFEEGKFKTVDNFPEELAIAEQAARNFMKRESRINIRVSQSDLNMIKRIAAQEGLPYQTLLASMIHKFASGRLQENNKSS